jgi:predicted O-linked N-acetylglucosamine transferase (SPINDLY family)
MPDTAPRPGATEPVLAVVARARELAARIGPAELQGADEGARLQEAVELVLGVLADLPDSAKPTASRVLWRAGQYAAADSLGDLAALGRYAATHGEPVQLLHQLPKAATDADRLELIHQHRLWAQDLEAAAAKAPIERPARTGPRDKLRLGLFSSDLRHHVVAFFAQPLFQHLDPRFELYAYSAWRGAPDVAQQWLAGRTAAFRILPEDDRAAAELIAADDLDLLVEMGGPTSLTRPGVLAYQPARRQASWLGYPHSLGLSAMDYFVADPWLVPRRRELLLEQPLLMPDAWVCLAPAAFQAEPAPAPEPPVARHGYVTFGTANDPYQFSPRLLAAWARVVAAVPGSRFMIVRPEAGAPVFREAIARHFAAEGVSADRLDFRPVRGGVNALYAEIDIALDTFPLTGGATTCDALWMGVPTVSLIGEAPYERLSASLLANAGLEDLVATTEADFQRIAVALAADPARLGELRRTLRERIRSRPLGQADRFAADFYELMARTIAADQAR